MCAKFIIAFGLGMLAGQPLLSLNFPHISKQTLCLCVAVSAPVEPSFQSDVFLLTSRAREKVCKSFGLSCYWMQQQQRKADWSAVTMARSLGYSRIRDQLGEEDST